MIVASASADSNVRIIAVKELVGLLSDPGSLIASELVCSMFPALAVLM